MARQTTIHPKRTRLAGVRAVEAASDHRFPRHSHDEFGIGLVTAGAQRSYSGRGEVEAVAGDALSEFGSAWPKIDVELSLDDRAVDLAGDAVDVVIRAGGLADSANLVARRLFTDPLVVCATPQYWERHGRPQYPDDLAEHACLNFRNRRTGHAMPWFFEIDGVKESQVFDGPLTIDDGEAVGRAARAGFGVSQMPGFMAAEALRSGQLEEVLQAFRPPEVPFTALYLDRRLVSPKVRAFIDFVSDRKPPSPDRD